MPEGSLLVLLPQLLQHLLPQGVQGLLALLFATGPLQSWDEASGQARFDQLVQLLLHDEGLVFHLGLPHLAAHLLLEGDEGLHGLVAELDGL